MLSRSLSCIICFLVLILPGEVIWAFLFEKEKKGRFLLRQSFNRRNVKGRGGLFLSVGINRTTDGAAYGKRGGFAWYIGKEGKRATVKDRNDTPPPPQGGKKIGTWWAFDNWARLFRDMDDLYVVV